MKRAWLAVAAATITLGVSAPAFAGQNPELRQDRRERLEDLDRRNQYRQEVRLDEREIIQDQRALRRAQASGDRAAYNRALRELERDRAELLRDKNRLSQYRAEYYQDTRELQRDRRYYRRHR